MQKKNLENYIRKLKMSSKQNHFPGSFAEHFEGARIQVKRIERQFTFLTASRLTAEGQNRQGLTGFLDSQPLFTSRTYSMPKPKPIVK